MKALIKKYFSENKKKNEIALLQNSKNDKNKGLKLQKEKEQKWQKLKDSALKKESKKAEDEGIKAYNNNIIRKLQEIISKLHSKLRKLRQNNKLGNILDYQRNFLSIQFIVSRVFARTNKETSTAWLIP